MSRKRSFFERLTGAVKLDEEEIEESKIEELQNSIVEEPENKSIWKEEDSEGELAVDVYQTPTHLILKTMVAGVHPDDVDVQISRDMVILKGHRQEEKEVKTDDYYHKELYWGTFSRTIVLPVEVEAEEAEAYEKHGLLIIKIPKIDKHRQTKVKVRSN
jgi:HSP20 family protein